MKTLTILSTAVCLFAFTLTSTGQINSNVDKTRMIDTLSHSLGLHAGLTTGIGLSYRFRPNRFGVQATFGPLKTEERTDINAGVSFLYVLFTHKDLNFFLYQGNSFRYSESTERVYNPALGINENVQVEESFTNHGFGFGTEFIGYDRIGLNLMVGYGAFENFKLINVTGEVGVYVYL